MEKRWKVEHEEKHVLVKIPKPGEYMRFVKASSVKTEGKEVWIQAHWVHSMFIPGEEGRVLNKCFYNISSLDLGSYRVGTVKIVRKIIEDEEKREYTLLDFFRTDGEPKTELKISPECPEGVEKKFPIVGTTWVIYFKPWIGRKSPREGKGG